MSWLSDDTIAHLRAVADEPDLSGTKYRLIELLGRGGMGSVWLAEDTDLGREVALKVLTSPDADGALAARMLREARILARLEHPGIVPVHDVGRLPDGRMFYVMKRIRGRRLDELSATTLDRDSRLRIFERICEAVTSAHAQNVLHRDLKPENVMVGEFGEVLVLDWGVAKILTKGSRQDGGGEGRRTIAGEPGATGEAEHDNARHNDNGTTAHGTRVGTPGFMAPEQAVGDVAGLDVRTDVWGLGALLHVLVRGGPPAGDTKPDTDEPKRLTAILDKALAREPALRYDSAAALAEDVQRFRTGANPAAYREPFLERAARVAWRYRVPIALVLTYVLVRALLLVFTGR